jgi:opacity protein-like surface antigen
MQARRLIVLVPMFALAIAGSARGQQVAPTGLPAVPEQRGYIAALGGAISGPPTEPVFSVEYGENLHRDVQAYVAISYVDNLMRESLRDDVADLAASLRDLTGLPWRLRGRDRGVVFVAGAKYLVGDGRARPYIGAGAGIINLTRTIHEDHLGDVTVAVFNDFDVGIGDLSLEAGGATKPLAEAVAGVGFAAGRTYVDVAYRFRRAFGLANRLEFSQFTVGVGYKF